MPQISLEDLVYIAAFLVVSILFSSSLLGGAL
jgi:hypothetical protein